jgi:K+-transporting ATPase KdpF subunit
MIRDLTSKVARITQHESRSTNHAARITQHESACHLVKKRRIHDRSTLYPGNTALFCREWRLCRFLRTVDGGATMSLYLIVGLIALILLVYLFVALLKPEFFG